MQILGLQKKAVCTQSSVICAELLTHTDFFVSSHDTERQVFVLHLFSAFIWAITESLHAQDFHPASVHEVSAVSLGHFANLASTSDTNLAYRLKTFSRQNNQCQIKNDKIENLVQELHGMGLATSDVIYQVLIPPLSHYDKLPNEVMADWYDERLNITRKPWKSVDCTFGGCKYLIEWVQDRKAQDRFANRVAAILVRFLFRTHEDPKPWVDAYDQRNFKNFIDHVEKSIKSRNETFFKSIQSLSSILERQGKIKTINQILCNLNLEHFRLEYSPSAHTVNKNDFTFPNSTDVFGWTEEYWQAFKGDPIGGKYYKMVDPAGRSVLHNAIDGLEDDFESGFKRLYWVIGGFRYRQLLQDEFIAAGYDKQTPLHRAIRTGRLEVIIEILPLGIDPNAADVFGRTALCFAAHQGNPEVVERLCEIMKGGLDQKDHGQRSALVYAILNNKEDAALTLIQRKIEFIEEDQKGRTPLWYAASKGMEKVVKALLNEHKVKFDVHCRSEKKPNKVCYCQGGSKIVWSSQDCGDDR